MIARILKGASTQSSLEYNEKKEKLGVASKLAVNNLPQGRPDLYESIFKFYNEDVIVNENFKNKGFHMTISPGANETMTDEKAKKFIGAIMKKMGMGSQPYIIYKHEDTGHVHYHIVSTLVKLTGKYTGKKVEEQNHFTNLETLKNLKELEEAFGYTTGKDPTYDNKFKKTPKFEIKKGNTIKQFKSIFEDASEYFFESMQEFEAILLSKNVKVKKRTLREGLLFFGTDYKGKILTQPQGGIITDEDYRKIEDLKKPLFRYNNKELEKNIEDTVEKALYLTNSKKEFKEYLRGQNIDVIFEESKKGGYSEVFYIDNTSKAIFRNSEFTETIPLHLFNRTTSTRWNKKRQEEENITTANNKKFTIKQQTK